MESSGRLLLVLGIILGLVLSLWIYNYFYTPHAALALPSFVQTDQGSPVLIVDMNADDYPSLTSVAEGDDAFIAIHQNPDPLNHENDIVTANNITLSIFDQNKDGRIDAHDHLYRQLEVKYRDKDTGEFRYMPINQAGIRAIYIDPKYFSKFGPPNVFPRPIGTAIMSDGTARLIRQVMIADTTPQSLSTQNVNQPGSAAIPTTTPGVATTPAATSVQPAGATPSGTTTTAPARY